MLLLMKSMTNMKMKLEQLRRTQSRKTTRDGGRRREETTTTTMHDRDNDGADVNENDNLDDTQEDETRELLFRGLQSGSAS